MDALAGFIVFQTKAGVDVGINLQNFYAEESRTYLGRTFAWAGFGYSGASVDLNATNTEAQLGFAITPLTITTAKQAAEQEWLVEVNTVWINPDTMQETTDRLTEIYTVTSYRSDTRTLTMNLSSPLDAQSAEIPSRVLTARMVGQLPATGQVSLI